MHKFVHKTAEMIVDHWYIIIIFVHAVPPCD